MIISDCEGYEAELINPLACPILQQCDMLIEVHDFIVPEASKTIANRFSATHECEVIEIQSRDPAAFPWLSIFPETDRLAAVTEVRNPNLRWIVMQSRARV